MRKPLLFLTLFVGSASAAQAQQSSTFGIKAGGTLSHFVGKDVSSGSSAKLGFHGGLVANLGINERFSIQPELLYSMKGIRDKATSGGATLTGYQTLHYVDVPVLVKAKFNQLFLEAGPQLGVLVAAKATVESGSLSNAVSNKSAFNDLDVGYALGLGYQAANGPMVGVRYNGGLANITKEQLIGGRSMQLEAHNSAFQLYVGYMFDSK